MWSPFVCCTLAHWRWCIVVPVLLKWNIWCMMWCKIVTWKTKRKYEGANSNHVINHTSFFPKLKWGSHPQIKCNIYTVHTSRTNVGDDAWVPIIHKERNRGNNQLLHFWMKHMYYCTYNKKYFSPCAMTVHKHHQESLSHWEQIGNY